MLREVYGRLLLRFGLREFEVQEVREVLGERNPYLILHRLWREGYLVRVSRGVFRAVHPVLLAMEWAGYGWRGSIGCREHLPFLEKVVARIVEGFWGRLVSLILFGSLATGKARPESDIDLLIVAEGLPERYSERLKRFRDLMTEVEDERAELWRSKGIYPLLDPILLTPEEARSTQPFYLDLLDSSVIIYDKDGFMRRKLEEVRRRLRELGSVKITLPDGSWYWVLSPKGRGRGVLEV